MSIIVEGVSWYPREMSETIPLSSALRIQLPRIIIGNVLS